MLLKKDSEKTSTILLSIGSARLGLSSEWALVRGGADLDVVFSSLRTASKCQSASQRIGIPAGSSLCVGEAGSDDHPDHVVSHRRLGIQLSDLHLDHGRERLPLRCPCFRSALLHHGRGHSRGSLVGRRREKGRLIVSPDGSRRFRAGMHLGRTRARILVVRGYSCGQRCGCADLRQWHEQYHATLDRTLHAMERQRGRFVDGK